MSLTEYAGDDCPELSIYANALDLKIAECETNDGRPEHGVAKISTKRPETLLRSFLGTLDSWTQLRTKDLEYFNQISRFAGVHLFTEFHKEVGLPSCYFRVVIACATRPYRIVNGTITSPYMSTVDLAFNR